VAELRIETRKRSDALCISERFPRSELSRSRRGWTITAPFEGTSELPDLLSALQECLDDEGVPSVVVEIDESRYVMERHP
jgi:hypothetical protein